MNIDKKIIIQLFNSAALITIDHLILYNNVIQCLTYPFEKYYDNQLINYNKSN